MKPDEVRTIFMGTPEFAVPSLRALSEAGYKLVGAFTQPDRPGRRGKRLVPPPVKVAAEELGITVVQPELLRRGGAIDELRELAPDIIVVAAYGQILRPAVIELPRFGCLNVHASLLPRWRGASCVAAAILAGDEETGATIMQIEPGLDTGPIVAQRSVGIGEQDTTGSLTDRLADVGAVLLIETLPDWISGALSAVPQEDAYATYASPLDKTAGEIDWHKPAVSIWREVRAYSPWPLSATRFAGEQLQILEAVTLVGSANGERPGTVFDLKTVSGTLPDIARQSAGFGVATGDGLLVPLRVRRAGRPAVTAAEFARGARGLIGSVLG